ncbi:MAG: hypothetical protein RLZZ229_363 [Actinomycetota bacterium]|jgi:hypothetical protein
MPKFNRGLKRWSNDEGSAVLELIGFGVVLQIPLLALAVQLPNLQLHQLAADSISRNAARAYVLKSIPLQTTANQIAKDFNLPPGTVVAAEAKPLVGAIGISVTVGSAKSLVIAKVD